MHVASALEDICGNNSLAAFDGPLRPEGTFEGGNRSIPFQIGVRTPR
jgi:hypothetical protein